MAELRQPGIEAAATRCAWALLACACAWLLGGCSSGNGYVQTASGQAADPQTVDYPIFYVKRYSVPTTQDDLRMMRFANLPPVVKAGATATPSGADLYMRSNASPSGSETNITQRITGTGTATAAIYDVKDVSVSADGTTILFTMRGPLTPKMKQNVAPSWRIWQYVIASDTLSLVINPDTDPDPATVNDVGPQFLPDGRIVFSSTRQRQSEAVLLDEGFPQFTADDEARTEPAFVLHVMNADGSNIHQISFNASDDRDPTVLMSGQVMWTRWDDAPGKDGMHLYTANPDGTNVQLFYGANSHATGTTADGANNNVIEFAKSHEMQTGRILSLVRPYTGMESKTAPLGTDFGGDLIEIDATDYVENTQPTLANPALTGPAQTAATTNEVLTVPGPSPGGRFYAGFPLWDGTGRILVSWSECRLLDTSVTPNTIVPCTSSALASPTATAAPPLYSVWMFDPSANTLMPVMQPVDGIMITDLVAAQPRTPPAVILDQVPGVGLNQDFYDAGVGVIDIRSVYDFDGVDTATPNIATVADPGKTPAAQRPARFIRLEKPVSLPDQQTLKLDQAAFGVTNYMREILGYAMVEPDGSVRIQVPSNVAFQISILDVNGRRISPVHDAWLQLRPGEEIKCNGCHTPAAQQNPATGQTAKSHGRANLFNSVYAGASATGVPFPDAVPTFSPNAGETMAETRSRTSCASDTPPCMQMVPSVEVAYADVWTNPAVRAPDAPFAYSYLDPTFTTLAPTNNNCLAGWASTCRIIINYIEHVQPLWDKTRQVLDVNGNVIADHTCNQGGCHNTKDAQGNIQVPAGQLDLTSTASTTQPLQFVSYTVLVSTHNEQTVNMGVLSDVLVPPGVPVPIAPSMVAGDAGASTNFFGRFAAGSGDSIHAGILSPSELRLLSEWLDIGAQYFNNPFDPKAPLN
jgi:hypothetical protein